MLDWLRNAVLALVGVALGLRVAWVLLEPAIPALIVIAALLLLMGLLFRRSE